MIRRLLRRAWPETLAARVVLVLLAGLTAFHLGSIWLHQLGSGAALDAARGQQIAERIGAAARTLAALPPGERERMAEMLSSPGLSLRWMPAPAPAGADGIDPNTVAAGMAGVVPMADGSRLTYSAAPAALSGASSHQALLSTTAMAGGILIVGLIVVRNLSRPLRQFAEAANRIGAPGAPALVLAEDGPREVQLAAQAFNRMQARIERLILDRTQALAAVSHDLRTPIARLRLRAGFLDDTTSQAAIDTDLDDMEAMIDSTLAYLRGESEGEEPRAADIAAILETLCDAAADAGHAVEYAGPRQARLLCRPVALKRALANLIDNAVKYGGGAHVSLEDAADTLTVRVEDRGPGIPAESLQTVFEPFRRLETSRNRGTGGAGLGLTIARQVAEAHGGTLTLANRQGGGLAAMLRLPRPPAAQASAA